MMILLIIASCLLFFGLNFFYLKRDFLSPPVLFPLIFLAQSIVCLIAISYLDLKFHLETLMILSISFLFFTVFYGKNVKKNATRKLESIDLNNYLVIFSIVILIFSIYLRYKYLVQFASVAGYGHLSFTEKVSFYDSVSKFNQVWFQRLAFYRSSLSNIVYSISLASGYVLVYVYINNYIVNKKISPNFLLIVSLLILNLYLGGSRSLVFNLITFIAFIYYSIYSRTVSSSKNMKKIIRKLIYSAVVIVVLVLLTLGLFGRDNNYSLFHYFFIYVGAPLYNLDNFIHINDLPIMQDYFGQQTFITFYSYWLPKFQLPTYNLDIPFVQYNDLYGLGNVYTTFYQFVYDFGLFGFIFPLIPMIVYYNLAFKKVQKNSATKKIDFNLFVYAYLFNDLVMLFFSNRFYETILSAGTVRFLLFAYVFINIFIEKKMEFFGIRFTAK